MSLQSSSINSPYKKFSLHLTVLCTSLGILLLFYFVAPESFFTISKTLISCLAFFLIISSYYSKYISPHALLPALSLFYGLINILQLLQVVGIELLNNTLSPFFLSIKTYYVGRVSFAIALIFISYTYVHKKKHLDKVICLLVMFTLTFLLLSFFIFTDSFITFTRSHSIGALWFNLANLLIMPCALTFAFAQLSKVKEDIPTSHKKIFMIFLICSSVMECIDMIYFIPLTSPRIFFTFFKLITLSLLVIGQLDTCILRPFEEIYLKRKAIDELIATNTKDYSHYLKQVEQLELMLHSRSMQYEKLLDILPDAFIISINGIIHRTNKAALTLFEVNDISELIGKNILSYIHDVPDLSTQYASALACSDKLIEGQGQLLLPNDKRCPIEYVFTANTSYTSDTVICMIKDVTLKHESQNTQEALFNQQLKLRYFSSISHDIKTPINIIYSALQMQSHASTVPECIHYTDMMHTSCLRLLKLLNNLLDLTKIDNKMFSIAPQVFNIVDAVESLCEVSSYYMASKKIDYIFDTDVDEKLVSLDPHLIERVILNLLSNAIKYTPSEGHISICIHDYTDYITIHIKDTGVGISPQQINTIFDCYTMLNRNDGTREHSSGMGLSIVNDLLNLMDATITCHSIEGMGSEFIIQLPTPSLENIIIDTPYNVHYSTENIKVEFCDI